MDARRTQRDAGGRGGRDAGRGLTAVAAWARVTTVGASPMRLMPNVPDDTRLTAVAGSAMVTTLGFATTNAHDA